jgi:hypothetical protein
VTEVLRMDGVGIAPDGGGEVQGFDLVVRPGEVVAILGDRKRARTIGRMAAGVLEPTEGRVVIDGVPAAGRNPEALRRAVFWDLGRAQSSRSVAKYRVEAVYPSWDEDRYRGALDRLASAAGLRPRRFFTRGPTTAALALGTGAAVVVLRAPLADVPAARASDYLAALVAEARLLGVALILVPGWAAGTGRREPGLLEEHSDRAIRPDAGRTGLAGRTVTPLRGERPDRARVRRLVIAELRPDPRNWGELALYYAACAYMASLTMTGDSLVVRPLLGLFFASYFLTLWTLSSWSPPMSFADLLGPAGGRARDLPLSAATLTAFRWRIAALRLVATALPLVLVPLLVGDARVALQGVASTSLFAVLALTVALTPLQASALLLGGGARQTAVVGLGALLAIVAWKLAWPDGPQGARRAIVAVTSPLFVVTAAAAILVGVHGLAAGLRAAELGTARGRRAWGPRLLLPGLALCAVAPVALSLGLPTVDWRDLVVPHDERLDERQLFVRVFDPSRPAHPHAADGVISWVVNVDTWTGTPLPSGTVALFPFGAAWGRVVRLDDGTQRLEIAQTPFAAAEVRGPPWKGSLNRGAAATEFGLVFATYNWTGVRWLAVDGRSGVLEKPDQTAGWAFHDEDGVLEIRRRPPSPDFCPEGAERALPMSLPEGGRVIRCDHPDGPVLLWDDDQDPGTPPRQLQAPTPDVLSDEARTIWAAGPDGRLHALGPAGRGRTVWELDGDRWNELQRFDGAVTRVRWMGPGRLLVQWTSLGAWTSFRLCDVVTGECSAPPLR